MWCFPLSHTFENTVNHSRKLTYLWSKVTHGNLKPCFQWSSCCFKRSAASWVFGYMLQIPELRRQRQEGEQFKVHLCYTRVLGYSRPFLGEKKIRQQHTSQTLPSARCAAAHRTPGKWSNNSNWKAKQHRTPATNSVLTKGSEQPTMATACRALNILVVCPESDVWWTPTLGCLGHHGTPLFNNKIQHSLVTPSFHHLVMETEQQSHLVDKETQVWVVNICIKIARLGE